MQNWNPLFLLFFCSKICAQESATLERLSALEEENTELRNALGKASELLGNFEQSEQEVATSLQAKDETIGRLAAQLEELLEMMEARNTERRSSGRQHLSTLSSPSSPPSSSSSPSLSSPPPSPSPPPLPPRRPPPLSRQQRASALAEASERWVLLICVFFRVLFLY